MRDPRRSPVRGAATGAFLFLTVYCIFGALSINPQRQLFLRALEELTFDARIAFAPWSPPSPRVVIVSKPEETSHGEPFRETLAGALEHLHEAGAASIGIDYMLLEPSHERQDLNDHLTRALASEEMVLASEILYSEGTTGVTGRQRPGADPVGEHFEAYRGAWDPFADAAPFTGLINFEFQFQIGKVLHSAEMWQRSRIREDWIPSLGFQVYLVSISRDALDRSGLSAARLAGMRQTVAQPAGLARNAIAVAESLRSELAPGGRFSLGVDRADSLLVRTEFMLLMMRAGASAGLARQALASIEPGQLINFLPINSPRIPLAYSSATRERSRLYIDFHGARGGTQSPFVEVPMSTLASTARFAGFIGTDTVSPGDREVQVAAVTPGTLSVRGRAMLSTGAPAAGAHIILHGRTGYFSDVVSGPDGRFGMSGLEVGSTRFHLWQRFGANVQVSVDGPGPVINSANNAEWVVQIPAPTTRATLTLASASIPPDARLTLHARSLATATDQHAAAFVEFSVGSQRGSGSSGKREFTEMVPAGAYSVGLFSSKAVGRRRYTNAVLRPPTAVVTVTQAASPLFDGSQTLEGETTGGQSTKIEVIDAASGLPTKASVDLRGHFRVVGLSGGDYLVLARQGDKGSGVCLPNRDLLRGALCLMGTRLTDDQDFYITPGTRGDAKTFGVEVHGMIIDNLLNGRAIHNTTTLSADGEDTYVSALWGLTFAVSAGVALSTLPLIWWGLTSWCILILGYSALSTWLLVRYSLWIDWLQPCTTLVMVLTYHGYMHYVREHREAQRRREIFSRFVSPEVVDLILALPADELPLFGERCQVTVLFCDIRGFTTISEGLDPRELMDMLRDYFSAMAPILKKHGGVVDKFIGDAIMGFFGAPIPMVDHPERAVAAAVEMLEVNEKLRRERRHGFDIGFGINTGDAVVGVVGDRDGRVNYSAIGDTVNLASRLEGLNKTYGTHVLISESTYLAVRNHFECVPIGDRVRVKGKLADVAVFEVTARKGQPEVAARFPVGLPPAQPPQS